MGFDSIATLNMAKSNQNGRYCIRGKPCISFLNCFALLGLLLYRSTLCVGMFSDSFRKISFCAGEYVYGTIESLYPENVKVKSAA